MRTRVTVSRTLTLGSLLATALALFSASSSHAATTQAKTARAVAATPSVARSPHGVPAHQASSARSGSRQALNAKGAANPKNGKVRLAGRGGGLQCVAFARGTTGIGVSGNAWQWWDNAAGSYARGSRPEAGSILSFRSNGAMRLGHVAVVSHVINARQIEIDHANWAGPGANKGGVSRGVSVVDVSDNNDWTAVRVGLGHTGDFGSVYPTNGFIYDRPDQTGTVMAAASSTPAPAPDLKPAPRDLRPASERAAGYQTVSYANGYEEVAEAPAAHAPARATRRKPHRTAH